MKEISKEIIVKVFACYPECSLLIYEPGLHEVPHYLEGVDFETNQVIAERVNYDPLMIKLMLTPLTDITEDDLIRVAKLELAFNLELATDWSNDAFRLYGAKIIHGEKPISFAVYQMLQYLWYDLPHFLLEGQTLIEAGLAVNKKDYER